MIAAEGFGSMDAGWLQQMAVFIAATLAATYYAKKTFFDKTTSVKIEGTIATTKYVDGKTSALEESIKGLLTTREFMIHQKHAEEDREELKESIGAAVKKLETYSSDGYRSRRAMHAKVNAHSNALHFIAGQHTRGPEIKRILDRADQVEDET